MHINILELKAAHLVLLTFTKMFQNKSIHVQMYKLNVKIITAKYLLGSLNIKQITCRAIFRTGVNGCFAGKLFRKFAKSGDIPT